MELSQSISFCKKGRLDCLKKCWNLKTGEQRYCIFCDNIKVDFICSLIMFPTLNELYINFMFFGVHNITYISLKMGKIKFIIEKTNPLKMQKNHV